MAQKLWLINKYFGGLSSGEKRGIEGSFKYGENLDIRSDPDGLKPSFKLTKNSSTIIADLPKWIIPVGTNFYAYGDVGKIYKKTTSWELLQTTSSAAGQGLAYFNDYVYYRQNTQLGRYGLISGSPSFTDNYKTGLTSITDHAPIMPFTNKMLVANGRYLATLDDSEVWSATALTLPPDEKIRALADLGDYAAIGTWKGSTVSNFSKGRIYFWDGTSTTYNSFIEVSGAVNAILNYKNIILTIIGSVGDLYALSGAGGQALKIKRMSLLPSAGKFVEVYPGAVGDWKDIAYFGAYGDSDDTTVLKGVYTYGSTDKDYPQALNFEHLISTGTKTGNNTKVGAVCGTGPTSFYVGWRDGSSYGIDLIDTTTYTATCYYQPLMFDGGEAYREKWFTEFVVNFKPLTTGQSIELQYKLNRTSSWTSLGTISYDASNTGKTYEKITSSTPLRNNEFELQLVITTNGATIYISSIVGTYIIEKIIGS